MKTVWMGREDIVGCMEWLYEGNDGEEKMAKGEENVREYGMGEESTKEVEEAR